jgi:pimeloyl-ACP methyl ester carboxylesterase
MARFLPHELRESGGGPEVAVAAEPVASVAARVERLTIRLPEARPGGAELAVRLERPAGDPAREPFAILYLHGFGSAQAGEKGTFFRERAVEAGFAFCSFDFRGHGESGGSLEDLTLSRNLEDVARVRSWLAAERGYRRIVLVGSSMGGATALWSAAREPRGVLGCAAIAPALSMLADLESWAGPDGLETWERAGRLHLSNDQVDAAFRWDLIEDLRRYPLEALLAAHRGPCLIFQGREDPTVDWRVVADFARRARRGSVEMLLYDDGDHRLLDRKPELWDRLAAFLARLA